MPVPVAFPLASFLTRAGITALGTGAATEGIKSLQNQGVVNPNMAQQALMRTIMGPTSEIFNRTTDTPSGKVFAPTGEVIEPNQIPGIAPPEQQQGITGLPIPEQQQGITGLPIPEKAPGLPGLINPEQVDTSILNKEETTENVSTQDLTVENIQNKIKYKKSKENKNITEAYLGDKKVGEIRKDMDSEKIGNQFNYTIHWTNEKGEIDYDDYNVETGFNSAKYTTALGLVNTIKSQEKEYLNKFIKAVENKDYDTLNKIREEERGYDFEDSEFRSKEFKDTLIKYIPKQVDLYRNNAILEQEAIKETLNKPGSSVENLTEDQNLFNENALAKQDDQAYQVNMTPDQYLSLTRKIESGDLENTKERTQRIKDAIKKGGKIENYPYLYIKKEGDNFLVTGEEGRHRALVLKELGVKQMPVMIRGIGSAKDGIENKRYTTPATGYAATDPYLKKFAGYKPKLIISDKTAEKPFQISWENLTTELEPTEKNTSKSAGSLTEVSTNPSEPFDNTDTSAVDFFPFNPIDFKKNGILNNPEIVKAFDDLKNDVKIKPPVGFNEDYMALQQSDSFYLTPPRAQMEITLKYLEKQLEENKASEETLNLIKNLNKDLQAKIKDTGYYAENKKVEDRITNLPGMTNKLKKLKSSN